MLSLDTYVLNLAVAHFCCKRTFKMSYHDDNPVVIVGMAMRLPGNIRKEDDFWDMLISKRDGYGPVPEDRLHFDGFRSKDSRPESFGMSGGYYLDLDDACLAGFDASMFSLGPREARRIDPAQRQLLEIARECMDNAGEVDATLRGRNVGCYVGTFGEDWLLDNAIDPHHAGLYRGTGLMDFFLANRVSFEYDWHGPSMVVKTGCSASMVALHLATESLKSGGCDAALVMGVNTITNPLMTQILGELGLLSPGGKCRTFDASGDGYGRGEAVNAVYVKRLADALRDGNRIRAVIRGSRTNHDGRKLGMMNPSSRAQEALIRATYRAAGISADEISQTAFFECHGSVSKLFTCSRMLCRLVSDGVRIAQGQKLVTPPKLALWLECLATRGLFLVA